MNVVEILFFIVVAAVLFCIKETVWVLFYILFTWLWLRGKRLAGIVSLSSLSVRCNQNYINIIKIKRNSVVIISV